MTTAFEAYKAYLAVKSHFSSGTYDYFKYNGEVRASKESFDARKDIMKFQKLARIKYSIPEYLAVLMRDEPALWVGGAVRPDAELKYLAYRKIIEGFTYHYGSALEVIGDIKSALRVPTDGSLPHILILFLRKEISLEVMIVLDNLIGFSKKFDEKLAGIPVWTDLSFRMMKFRPFMAGSYDTKKITELTKVHVASYK